MAAPFTTTNLNGVKVYNLASGKTLPEWLKEKSRAQLKKDEAFRRRVELLQDFEFPMTSQRVRMSPDGTYIAATGVYPPMIRMYDTRELSMKFERRMDSEVTDFRFLSDDYSKLVFLHNDRYIEVHAAGGRHHRVRIPKFGRALLYEPATCDLYAVGSSPEIYRLNMEIGSFMTPLQSSCPAINAIEQSSAHGLLGCAGEDGMLECWDPRYNKAVGRLDVAAACKDTTGDMQATSLQFDSTGLIVAVGTSTGLVSLFDIRSSVPLMTKEHQYGLPIHTIQFHTTTGNVISADAKLVKIWNQRTGENFANVETSADSTQIELVRQSGENPDTGVIMAAGEQSRVMAYYIPQLGVAPKWCYFLDHLTEELEQAAAATVYEDYKFITRDELKNLGLEHLIGTPLLKAYMHGFFMDMRLYTKVSSIVDPFAFDRWRKEKVQQKIAERRQSRITMQRKLPKVNAELAAHLLNDNTEATATAEDDTTAAATGAPKTFDNPLGDDRFKAMFSNPDFQRDADSDAYKARFTTRGEKGAAKVSKMEDLFEEVDGEDEDEDKDEASDAEDGRRPRMLAVRDTQAQVLGLGTKADAAAIAAHRQASRAASAPLGARVAEEEAKRASDPTRSAEVRRFGAVREMSFMPTSGRGSREDRDMMRGGDDDEGRGRPKKRPNKNDKKNLGVSRKKYRK